MRQLTGTARAWVSVLRQEIASSELLPQAYAHYQPLLADALCFFLTRISPVRLQQIFVRQLQLPISTSTAQRVVCLLEQLPALHKLGQVVARDRRLNAAFRRRLQQLESLTPQLPTAHVVRLLGGAFKGWEEAGIALGAEPLAEGSVAVIMPFVWRDAPGGPRPGVFKLLKPGIRVKLEEDLEILSQLGAFLDENCEKLHLPVLEYKGTFDSIRDLLLHEVRFEEEQDHLAEAARVYRENDRVTVPTLFPFCSSKLTTMERLFGQKVPGNQLVQPCVRESTAQAICRALIATPIFSPKSASLFHADPHAGNLLITDDGHVGILDWSLTGRLQKRQRIDLVQMLLGAFTLDVRWIETAVERLSQGRFNRPVLRSLLEHSLQELRDGISPGIHWLTRLLDQLTLEAGLRLDRNLLLFRKSLLTLDGVVSDLTANKEEPTNALLDEAVIAGFVEQWMLEWPRRFLAPFEDRSFGTHVSAADVFRLMLSVPLGFVRGCGTTR
jgi:ubiquinone biosynthesis protein